MVDTSHERLHLLHGACLSVDLEGPSTPCGQHSCYHGGQCSNGSEPYCMCQEYYSGANCTEFNGKMLWRHACSCIRFHYYNTHTTQGEMCASVRMEVSTATLLMAATVQSVSAARSVNTISEQVTTSDWSALHTSTVWRWYVYITLVLFHSIVH